jgi:hypothetical protein
MESLRERVERLLASACRRLAGNPGDADLRLAKARLEAMRDADSGVIDIGRAIELAELRRSKAGKCMEDTKRIRTILAGEAGRPKQ